MEKNKLEIITNGSYRNINLKDMEDGDVITVTKKYDEVQRKEKQNKYDSTKTYNVCFTGVVYNNEDVTFIFPSAYNSEGTYVTGDDYADVFDDLGAKDTVVEITCKEGKTKDKKGNKIISTDYVFKKVEE